ncbi:MAG: response regulator [Pontiellaceae bacterium]|nr:response regulator [Pontiellaceae bacterium]
MTPKIKHTAESRRLKILVMDDEKVVQTIFQRMLTHLGHEVILADHGREAIAIYQEYLNSDKTIDLFILDLTIPNGMGGKDVAYILKDHNPDVRAIVTSGYPSDEIMCNHTEHGFSAAIAKPFETIKIKEAIDKAMASSAP